LFFNFHEIRGGGFVDFVVFYGTGGLDLATEEQKFLCEGGFSGIGVGDDGKGFAFGDFGFVEISPSLRTLTTVKPHWLTKCYTKPVYSETIKKLGS